MVKVVEAEGPPLESVMMTGYVPAAKDGTINVAFEIEPDVSVIAVPWRVKGELPNVAVIVELLAKSDPETLMIDPALPLVEFNVIVG